MIPSKQRFRFLFVVIAAFVLLCPRPLPAGEPVAQPHVVSAAELHSELQTAATSREARISKLQEFFRTAPARQALERVKLDLHKVQTAVPFLNEAELAKLAWQADRIEKDFRAGALTNQELTYIVIALATAVIILVIVAA